MKTAMISTPRQRPIVFRTPEEKEQRLQELRNRIPKDIVNLIISFVNTWYKKIEVSPLMLKQIRTECEAQVPCVKLALKRGLKGFDPRYRCRPKNGDSCYCCDTDEGFSEVCDFLEKELKKSTSTKRALCFDNSQSHSYEIAMKIAKKKGLIKDFKVINYTYYIQRILE